METKTFTGMNGIDLSSVRCTKDAIKMLKRLLACRHRNWVSIASVLRHAAAFKFQRYAYPNGLDGSSRELPPIGFKEVKEYVYKDGEKVVETKQVPFWFSDTEWRDRAAVSCGVSKSLFWRYFGAGRALLIYMDNVTKDISGVELVNPENLDLAEKAGRGTPQAVTLIAAAVEGRMTKKELSIAHATRKQIVANMRTKKADAAAIRKELENMPDLKELSASAVGVIGILRTDSNWLSEVEAPPFAAAVEVVRKGHRLNESGGKRALPQRRTPQYVVYPEFTVTPVTERNTGKLFKLDALIIESVTPKVDGKVVLHGIIAAADPAHTKVVLADGPRTDCLTGATDYVWCAMPEPDDPSGIELPDGVGLLFVSDNNVHVSRPAAYRELTDERRAATLEQALIRALINQ